MTDAKTSDTLASWITDALALVDALENEKKCMDFRDVNPVLRKLIQLVNLLQRADLSWQLGDLHLLCTDPDQVRWFFDDAQEVQRGKLQKYRETICDVELAVLDWFDVPGREADPSAFSKRHNLV